MSHRRIIQIAEAGASNGHSLHALCNDGSVWEYDWHANPSDEPPYSYCGGWKRLAEIPQPPPPRPAVVRVPSPDSII
jgi:hypothetical protein